jgi:hypothetical protein
MVLGALGAPVGSDRRELPETFGENLELKDGTGEYS